MSRKTSQLRYQSDMDVERLRKAADRILDISDAHTKLYEDLHIATGSLKIIATWAKCLRVDYARHDADRIHDRAMDTLRLMGEVK